MDMGSPQADFPEDDIGLERDMVIRPNATEVDPNCIDGKYSEALPTPTADIST